MTKRVLIHERRALSALLGRPAACLWQTETTGWGVSVWTTYDDGFEMCTAERECKSRAEAENWARKQEGCYATAGESHV